MNRETIISEDLSVDIVWNVFVHKPSSTQLAYNFKKALPDLNGQIGVPPIVDKILGILYKISQIYIELVL